MSEWQDISTAPKDKTEILLSDGEGCSVAYWDGRAWQVVGDGANAVRYMSDFGTEYLTHDYPTHWMPIPPIPKVKP